MLSVEDLAGGKLKVVSLDVGGGGDPLSVVTNASNVAEGQRVVVATVGSVVRYGFYLPFPRAAAAATPLIVAVANGQRTKLRIVTLRARTAREKMALGRWADPKRSRRTCTREYGLQSRGGKPAGVAKRPHERSPTRNPTVPILKPFSTVVRSAQRGHS